MDDVTLSHFYIPEDLVPKPQGTTTELGLAGTTKVLCSAVYVSNRTIDEALPHAMALFLPDNQPNDLEVTVDQENDFLQITMPDGSQQKAFYREGYGCTLADDRQQLSTVPAIKSKARIRRSALWPKGERTNFWALPEGIDREALEGAVDLAFPQSAYTAALIVVYKGQMIAEKYGEGIDQNTQLESWSMGKSLTATLIGRMIQEGHLKLDDPLPVEAWQKPGDPRQAIMVKHLLQMSSGLQFTAHRDPEADQYQEYLDHFYIYTGGIDAFAYSFNRPLEYLVGTTGRYRNCDPLILGYVMRQTLTSKEIDYHTYAQESLFDPLGIREQVMEVDPFGNFLLTGFDYGTARNWAKLGLLYLQNGQWDDQQLLPEDWSTLVASHAPGWEQPVYGGLFWINGTKEMPIPENAYYMAGAGGQRTIIIPEKELVVVRMGHFKGSNSGMEALNQTLARLMEIIP